VSPSSRTPAGIAYDRAGPRGEVPVVLLHAGIADRRMWDPIWLALAVERDVVRLDFRGFGESARRPRGMLSPVDDVLDTLALAQTHPEQVQTVIAHEPPMDELLDDRERRRTVTEDIIATYRSQGRAAAWRIFLADANIHLPEELFSAMFAGPLDDQEAADEDHFFLHELLHTNTWAPDIIKLRNTPARFIVGIGTESVGQSCDRISRALASALDVESIMFPGGHTGFIEDPASFAARLQAVLQDADDPLR
jgi:pimeloyl-ACP methyl ester carboxylesterase